jgi:hypothetical protein
MKTAFTILSLILNITCIIGQSEETIFPLSKDKIVFNCPQTFLHFEDDKNDSLDLTPKISFFIDREPLIINSTLYYKFYLNKNGDSTCTGYLRKDKSKVYSIQNIDSNQKNKEKLLFDFGSRIGKSWETNMFKDFPNHTIKIKLKNKYYNKDFDEYLFDFEIAYRFTPGISINNLIVGEKNGIVGVNFITHYGSYINCEKY